MNDPRPLSERFDLTYVKRPHYADRWTGRIAAGVVLLLTGLLGAAMILGDERVYTSGPLTTAHAMFADDCSKCHAASTGASGSDDFSRHVEDAKCLACHTAPLHHDGQSAFAGAMKAVAGHEVMMSSRCSSCHVEHRGPDVDLSAVSDHTCTQCHASLSAYRARGLGRVHGGTTSTGVMP